VICIKEYDGKELIIMATSNCNVSCKHCYISYSGSREPDELLSMVRKLKCKYNININGAENLTNLQYLQSYNEIGQTFILSNGKVFLNGNNIFKKLKENNILSVSLSYHFGIHDELSPIKIIDLNKIIQLLKANDIEYRFLTTITAINYKMIPSMCKKTVELGAKGIKFTNFLYQGNAKYLDKALVLNSEQLTEFFRLLLEERKKYKKEELLIERCGTFGKNFLTDKDNFYCDCITDSIVLTPDNNIYPCVFLAEPGNEIGRYDNEKILLYENLKNNHTKCMAQEKCNIKIKKLTKGEF